MKHFFCGYFYSHLERDQPAGAIDPPLNPVVEDDEVGIDFMVLLDDEDGKKKRDKIFHLFLAS